MRRRAGVLVCLILVIAEGCASQRPIYYKIDPKFSVNDPQFARTMGALLGPPLCPGNTCRTLRNGDEIFPAMLAAIKGARRTITFETYIYWSGSIGREFADAFCERARAGVKVHVLLDWFGSGRIDPRFLREMRNAGVQVREYHPFNFFDLNSYRELDHRTHRKILVVDGRIGFTGGVGVADVWRGRADRPDHWRDNHYRIEGPIVASLQAAFEDNWMQTSGVVLDGDDYYPPLLPNGPALAQVFHSSFQGGSESMQLMMLLSFACASQHLRIESAYFVPDALTRRSLIAARRRGVDIEIIVPGRHIDEKIVRQSSRAHWGELMKAGIRIYEYEGTMFHCKLLVVDDRWVSVGSANMDDRSFRLNDEANLNVLDEAFAQEQIGVFEEDKSRSRQISYAQWNQRPLMERIADRLSTLLDSEL